MIVTGIAFAIPDTEPGLQTHSWFFCLLDSYEVTLDAKIAILQLRIPAENPCDVVFHRSHADQLFPVQWHRAKIRKVTPPEWTVESAVRSGCRYITWRCTPVKAKYESCKTTITS